MNPELDLIERKIIRVLQKLDAMPGNWGAARSTSEVKRAIVATGKKMAFDAFATDRRESNFEWLYDVCWLSMDGDGDFVTDMPLALECEWGTSRYHILEDFQKLLVARAAHRVFLCSHIAPEDWHDPAVAALGSSVVIPMTAGGCSQQLAVTISP